MIGDLGFGLGLRLGVELEIGVWDWRLRLGDWNLGIENLVLGLGIED